MLSRSVCVCVCVSVCVCVCVEEGGGGNGASLLHNSRKDGAGRRGTKTFTSQL